MSKNFDGIKTQKFGCEVECTGLTRSVAAKALSKLMGNSAVHEGGSYDKYTVEDDKGRKWSVVYDGSIRCENKSGSSASKLYSVEMVTPVLEYEDIPLLQEAVRTLRRNGGRCNSSVGIHIHINGEPFDARTLRNFVNIIASKENMIYNALQVGSGRQSYCKKINKDFLERLNCKKPKTLDEFKNIWYNGYDGSRTKYHNSRYCMLNLHSFFNKGTIELRAFNGSLNAGVLRAYLSLALAVSNQALTQKSASPRLTESPNEKYTFRTWLIRIGLNGQEFKNCRKHLLSHLEGNIAWLHQEDAIAQRERLKQERIAVREQCAEPVSEIRELNENVPDDNFESSESECEVFEEYEENEDMEMVM